MKNFRIQRIAAAVCVALGTTLIPVLPAHALTQTANLAVSASVAANCTISTAAVAFGAYDPVVANALTALTGTGSVTIACTKNSGPTITLGLGAQPAGSTRQMANGAERLVYELYQPPTTVPGVACGALTQIWGTAGVAIFTPTVPASKAARTYNVCGSVAASQDVAVGAYADTVVATVSF
jgi:spore coat protein U-like protein